MRRVVEGQNRVIAMRRTAYILLPAAVTLVAGIAVAQEAPPSLEFSFSNPGARSMGLAGAFVALADDATAAFANPAGLVQLLRPEISIEFRRRKYSTPYTKGGRAQGEPTGWGIDTVDGVRTASSNETTSGLSFLSFVYPGTRWSLALYRHQLADFSVRTEINGLFRDTETGWKRNEDQLSITEVDIVGTGLSGAYRVNDRLSLGFGLSYFSGTVANHADVYSVDVFPDTFWERNSFLPHRKMVMSSFTVDDTDVGFNIGGLWKFADSWRLGAVYRKGPQFKYELYNRAGPLNPEPEGTILESVTDRSIAFPDVWGLGIAYRSPNGSLTVGFEWDRVEYSIIAETLDSPLVDTSMVAIDDANELRLGVEYVFLEVSPLFAIRGGIWQDPDHRFRYLGAEPHLGDEHFSRALYQQGEDILHVTAGVGIAFKKFQIDLGADLSQTSDIVALSAIYNF
jgi:long-subunit fatty acid transport protein